MIFESGWKSFKKVFIFQINCVERVFSERLKCGILNTDLLLNVIGKYSQLSLSRLRLSRITAYLEEKIWSLFYHRNLKSGYKILWKRGEIAPG